MPERAPHRPQRERDARENRLVENQSATAEEKDRAPPADAADEDERRKGRGRFVALSVGCRPDRAPGLAQDQVGGDEARDEIREHEPTAQFPEGDAERGERHAQQRGCRTEVAVEFSAHLESFAADRLLRHVKSAGQEARRLIVVERAEDLGLVETKRAERDQPRVAEARDRSRCDEPTVTHPDAPRG
jgi:hypothetical protein